MVNFAKASKKKYKGSSIATLTKKSLAAKLSNPKGWSRWWNSLAGDATFLYEMKPSGDVCKIFVDDACGRFLVSYGCEDRRSFSWTKRGMKEAQLHALRHLWESHERHTGQKSPINLDTLVVA